MRVVVMDFKEGRSKDVELPVTSLTLQRDPLDPLRLKMFHCSDCGRYVVQYQGNIFSIGPGGAPQSILEMKPNLIVKCLECNKRYLINGIV